MSTWTQPMCGPCWLSREGERIPHRVQESDVEQCAFCGHDTDLGIYIRANPATVPYPRKD